MRPPREGPGAGPVRIVKDAWDPDGLSVTILNAMNLKLSVLILVTSCCIAPQAASERSHGAPGDDETNLFDPPEALLTADSPFTGQMYPSPVLQDIDGDGKAELIVGDLPGRMRFATRKGNDLQWSKLNPMESGDEPLRLNNW